MLPTTHRKKVGLNNQSNPNHSIPKKKTEKFLKWLLNFYPRQCYYTVIIVIVVASCHLSTCIPHTAKASRCPFKCWMSSREAVNTNFYNLWFDLTGNRALVYRFSRRRSVHSTTDRLNYPMVTLTNNNILTLTTIIIMMTAFNWNNNQVKAFIKLAVIRRSVYELAGPIFAPLSLGNTIPFEEILLRRRTVGNTEFDFDRSEIWTSDLLLHRRTRYLSTNWPV